MRAFTKFGGGECKELNLARLPKGSHTSSESPPKRVSALVCCCVWAGETGEGGVQEESGFAFGLQVCYWEMLYSVMVKQCTLGNICGGIGW